MPVVARTYKDSSGQGVLPVVVADTVVDVGTVVVKGGHTAVAGAAVFGAEWLHRPACVTQSSQPTLYLVVVSGICHLHQHIKHE